MPSVDTIAPLPPSVPRIDARPNGTSEGEVAEFRPIAPRRDERPFKKDRDAPEGTDIAETDSAPDEGEPKVDDTADASKFAEVPVGFVVAAMNSAASVAQRQVIKPTGAAEPTPTAIDQSPPTQAGSSATSASIAPTRQPKPFEPAIATVATPSLPGQPAESNAQAPLAQTQPQPSSERPAQAPAAGEPPETSDDATAVADVSRTNASPTSPVQATDATSHRQAAIARDENGNAPSRAALIAAAKATRSETVENPIQTPEVHVAAPASTTDIGSTDDPSHQPHLPVPSGRIPSGPPQSVAEKPSRDLESATLATRLVDATPKPSVRDTPEIGRDLPEGGELGPFAGSATASRARTHAILATATVEPPAPGAADVSPAEGAAAETGPRSPMSGAGTTSGHDMIAAPMQTERFAIATQSQFSIAGPNAAGAAASPSEQIAVQISHAVRDGNDRLVVQLRQQSLGRIRIELEVAPDNRVIAVIGVERQETLDLLQRDARGLERALNDAGLKADAGSLSFNLRSDGDQRGHGLAEGRGPSLRPADTGDTPAPAPQIYHVYGRSPADGIDIRV